MEESDPGAGVLKDEQEFTRLRIKGGGEDIPERGNRCTKGAGVAGLSHKWKNFLWLDHRERKDRAA